MQDTISRPKGQRGSPKSKSILIPFRGRGRLSPEAEARYWAEVNEFANGLMQIASRLDFRPSSRGWCYILEEVAGVRKDRFDYCQTLINDCRKLGILPLDITSEDAKRQFGNLEQIDDDSPEDFARNQLIGTYGLSGTRTFCR